MNAPARPAVAAPAAMVWRFGSAQFDESRMELSVNHAPVALERKPLEVLRHLLRHAGEVVTKDELADAVWPGRILSETVLAKAISRLREVLDEAGAKAIKTVHGYGYRLLAEVSVAAPRPELRAAPQLALKSGDRPLNRPNWQLEEHLDSGGNGEVWRARHAKTGEQRVFKFALNSEGLAGLKREVTLHRLFGSQLGELAPMVPVLDFNLEEAPFFLEMNFIAGGNLAVWLEARGGARHVALGERLALFVKIAQGLAQAHAIGVLHKDLKPANILIENSAAGPRPLLCDFGSAGVMSDHVLAEAGITNLGFTQAAANAGATSLYLAPEVLRGQLFTTGSDLYALGVMLYQLVVGDLQHPVTAGWEADVDDLLLREDIAAAVQGDPLRRLSSVSELVQRLETLEARHAAAALEALRQQQTAEAETRAQALQIQAESLKLRRDWMLATIAVFLLGAVIASALAWRARDAAAEARAANASTQATIQFLVGDVLGAVSLRQGPAKQMTLNQIIERAAKKVDERFPAPNEAMRAQTYRALYEVYGVTDYKTLDPAFNEWLHERALSSVAAWFARDPRAAFAQAYQLVMEADFWNTDPKILQLLNAASAYAQSRTELPQSQKLALAVLQSQWRIKQGRWLAAEQEMRPLLAELAKDLPRQMQEEPYALITALNNATRLGLHAEAAALCKRLITGSEQPPLSGDAGLLLDALEACTVAAAYRGDAGTAVALASRGLNLARENYDDLVGYIPTFSRYLGTAHALEGRIVQGLALADYAVTIRRQRADELLPYVLVNRGNLRLAAGQGDKALADFREASELLVKTDFPLLAIEAHSRLCRLLAQQGDAAGARAAWARIAQPALAELPAGHRAQAHLLQAQAWLDVLGGQAQAAREKLLRADALLANIGYPVQHLERLELAADVQHFSSGGSGP